MSATPEQPVLRDRCRVHGPHRLRLLVLLAVVAGPAQAYIDPGSGMLLWQGLLAALGAVLMVVRHPLETIRRWLRRLRGK